MSSEVMNTGDEKNDNNTSFDVIQHRIESLSSKMDKLINIQEKVLNRLDGMSQDIDDIEKDMENMKVDKEEIHLPPKVVNQTQVVGQEVRDICQEMSTIMSVVNQRSEQQAQKLEGMEKLVLSMQQVISFIGQTVKRSRVMELMFKGPGARKGSRPKDSKGKKAVKRKSTDTLTKKLDKLKDHKGKDGTEKPSLSPKALKTQKKLKPPDTADHVSHKKQVLLLEEVQKLNRENTEKSNLKLTTGYHDLLLGVSPKDLESDVCNLQEDSKLSEDDTHVEVEGEEEIEQEVHKGEGVPAEEEPVLLVEDAAKAKEPEVEISAEKKESPATEDEAKTELSAAEDTQTEPSATSAEDHNSSCLPPEAEQDQIEQTEKNKQEDDEQNLDSDGWAVFKADGVELNFDLKEMVERERREKNTESDEKQEDEDDDEAERYFIDTIPPPAAPFNHRIVSAKPNQISNFYTINWQEVLGGGRFGQVHKCVENSSGLTLAAKVIKARSQKEKEVVKIEIQVMNNLDHANLIQLYAAYESRNDIILVLEYVGGGELFDRIIDENYTLMELDAVMFIRQICDGLQHMHKMYILHLDLKPENILCVNRVTNKIKIIDFGLARVYKPREKLKVNFGTPEFLAPEVINYDFVSFNTDMWSLGVITYMLLSSLCPFLGDNDNETLNNILACKWNFEEREFMDTSEEAKNFISRLLVVNKSWRMSASEALRHPWLSDPVLHHRLYTKKTMCRSRRSSCVPTTDS
ncbi:myosin light chain kinase 2, skeletal/cardiac muscle isoform X3 [Sphaeramia orbicularis]|uniref:myosin light chain kinase 2, skeletal/cardiac muscle isoform X3 n=1 Tax=Sphaeramia orbicularis TaxID=375764 RepID=UPI00117E910D|nr:myosin light chain kinase 2, skeletal/cardiac muscle-like isoform X3 [Sphaeramia orbicularis]